MIYVEGDFIVVYYEIKLEFLYRQVTPVPCIITLEEWLNQGGE